MRKYSFICSFVASMFAMFVCGAILGGAVEEVIRWSYNSRLFNGSMMIGDFILGGVLLILAAMNSYFVMSSYNDAVNETKRLENILKDE